MKVRKHTYSENGERRETEKFYAVFSDHNKTLRRLPLFTDRKASQHAANQIEKLMQHRAAGDSLTGELARFVECTLPEIRSKLAAWGILDTRRVEASKPLTDHLTAWETALRAKGASDRHVKQSVQRVRKVFDGCGFKFTSDVTAGRVREFLKSMTDGETGINGQTYKFYRGVCRQFCNWMVRDQRAAENPLLHLETPKLVSDRRHPRRAFTLVEIQSLMRVAYHGSVRSGMTGPERALLYRLAVETALRANEIRSLSRRSFVLDGNEPTVTVAAGYSKRRRDDTKLLSTATAKLMREHLANKLPDAKAFNMPVRTEVSRMFKFDLKAAGITYKDDSGRYADFHALRHTSGTLLKDQNIHPKLIQQHMRHSTITLTMDRYTHSHLSDEAVAVDAMPDLGWPEQQTLAATGTLGAGVQPLSPSLSPQGRREPTSTDVDGQLSNVSADNADTPNDDGIPTYLALLTGLDTTATLDDAPRRSGRVVDCAGLES